MNLKDTYNKIAEDWHAEHINDSWYVEGTEHFCSLLKKDDDVLDVGCGSGVKSNYLSKKGFKVTGIDFSEKLIEIARREYSQPEFLVMDMRDICDLNQKFDGVFIQASLLHISKNEVADVLKSLVVALKDSGYIYVAVKAKRPNGDDEAILEEDNYGYPYKRFFSYFTMDELRSYYKDLDLDVVYEKSDFFGKTNWLQIIGKKRG